MSRKKCAPVGSKWRILAWKPDGSDMQVSSNGESVFDELVISGVLHIEKMEDRSWWAQIGDAAIWIHVARNGDVTVSVERGMHGEERGFTISHLTEETPPTRPGVPPRAAQGTRRLGGRRTARGALRARRTKKAPAPPCGETGAL